MRGLRSSQRAAPSRGSTFTSIEKNPCSPVRATMDFACSISSIVLGQYDLRR